MAELVARRLAVEAIETEARGIRDRDDRIEPHQIAQFRAQEGERHRQRVGDPGRFDHQVVDAAPAIEDAKDRIEKIVVERAADAAVLHSTMSSSRETMSSPSMPISPSSLT